MLFARKLVKIYGFLIFLLIRDSGHIQVLYFYHKNLSFPVEIASIQAFIHFLLEETQTPERKLIRKMCKRSLLWESFSH